jgi:hypothetical protein
LATFNLSSGGGGAITTVIQNPDNFSKDGIALFPNVSPQGVPNSGNKSLVYNGSGSVAGQASANILFTLNNPG